MTRLVVAFAMLLASHAIAFGQSRDAALRDISETLARANELAPGGQAVAHASAADSINDAIKLVVELKDRLANNPYVRITSVSVGIPWGISVEFEVLQ